MKPTLSWQLRFLRSFLGGNRAAAAPFSLVVDVTSRCNLSCLHCRRHSPHSTDTAAGKTGADVLDFPTALFDQLCREAGDWGIRKVVLIGEGEPLLHSGLAGMIRTAKAAGCEVVLLTNGTMVDEPRATELVRTGLDELRFSLWASNFEEYEAQYPGTSTAFFDRTLEGIRHAVAAKDAAAASRPRIVLHRPMEPRFLDTLEASLDLAAETGCDAISFSPLKPLLPGDEKRLLTDEQRRDLVPILRGLARVAKRRGLDHNVAEVVQRLRIGREVWKVLPCHIGWIDVRIRVNGDVVPCDTCQWVMGNVHTQGLQEIWNSPGYREFRQLGRSIGGITRSGRHCICDYCCHATSNARLHRLLRWLPARTVLGRGSGHVETA